MLTERQREVLRLIAHGKLDREIAAELKIADRTVGHHVGRMLAVLQARTRAQAVYLFFCR